MIFVGKNNKKSRQAMGRRINLHGEINYEDSLRDYTTLCADKVSGESNVIFNYIFVCFFFTL